MNEGIRRTKVKLPHSDDAMKLAMAVIYESAKAMRDATNPGAHTIKMPCDIQGEECVIIVELDAPFEGVSGEFKSTPATTLGEQPFGTTHWAGTWNGFPAMTLSHRDGATLFYFDGGWKKKQFEGLAALQKIVGVAQDRAAK